MPIKQGLDELNRLLRSAEQQRGDLLAAIEQALKAEDDVFAPTVGTILRQARDKVLGD